MNGVRAHVVVTIQNFTKSYGNFDKSMNLQNVSIWVSFFMELHGGKLDGDSHRSIYLLNHYIKLFNCFTKLLSLLRPTSVAILISVTQASVENTSIPGLLAISVFFGFP